MLRAIYVGVLLAAAVGALAATPDVTARITSEADGASAPITADASAQITTDAADAADGADATGAVSAAPVDPGRSAIASDGALVTGPIGEVWFGSPGGVAAVGQIAYLGVLGRFLAIDYSGDSPERLGATGVMPGQVFDVALGQSAAFVAMGPEGLAVVDISDPTDLAIVTTLDLAATRVDVEGDRAYVLGSELRIYDVSVPAAPDLLGWATESAVGLDAVGTTVYLASGFDGMRIVDAIDPSAIVEIGSIDTPGSALDVSVIGSLALVADGTAGLRVVDITDQAAPVEIGSYEELECDPPDSCPEVARVEGVGGRAYIAVQRCASAFDCRSAPGVWLLDLADPTSPAEIMRVNTPSNPWQLAVGDDRVYLPQSGIWWYGGVGSCGLSPGRVTVFDAELNELDTYGPPASASAIASSPGWVYLVDPATRGLGVYDVSDPTQPVAATSPISVSWLGMTQGMWSLTDVVVGDKAYVSVGSQWDAYAATSDLACGGVESPPVLPQRPQNGCSPPPPYQWFSRLRVQGEHNYVIDAAGAFRVLSLDWDPREEGAVLDGYRARELTVNGDRAYLALEPDGMLVVDVADPAEPKPMGRVDGSSGRMVAQGSLVYMAAGEAGLRIIDVSDPMAPVERGSLDTPGYASDVAISGFVAFVADGPAGLRIVNVSDSGSPSGTGGFVDVPWPRRVDVQGPLLHVLGTGGLYIMRHVGTLHSVHVPLAGA